MRRSLIRIGRAASGQRGSAAVEFALLATVLSTIVLGTWDLGRALYQTIQLQAAVRAGGAYALDYPTDSSGIANAMSSAASASANPPTVSCQCGGQSTSCSTQCTSGLARTVTMSISVPFSSSLYPSLTQLSASAVARIQ